MKKQNIINLIKYHVERNESAFRSEALVIARYFDSIGDYQLAEYVMGLLSEANIFSPQATTYEGEYLHSVDIRANESLYLPDSLMDEIKGVINAINHNVGISKFLFEGAPGTGKTEAAKIISQLLKRTLLFVDFSNLIDSKLGQTNKNITELFNEISKIPNLKQYVILFDEIDVIALDRINGNDVREMGRATSTMLRELDRLTELNRDVIIIGTTNLYKNFDKALIRRFDSIISFDRYEIDDLIDIGEQYFDQYSKQFKDIVKDRKLFKKILRKAKHLPYPGELKNIIKISLAFSAPNAEHDYLKRLYNHVIGDLEQKDVAVLHKEGFTIREIEKLKGESKSSVSRKLTKLSE